MPVSFIPVELRNSDGAVTQSYTSNSLQFPSCAGAIKATQALDLFRLKHYSIADSVSPRDEPLTARLSQKAIVEPVRVDCRDFKPMEFGMSWIDQDVVTGLDYRTRDAQRKRRLVSRPLVTDSLGRGRHR